MNANTARVVGLVLLLLGMAACAVVYVGDPRTMQSSCLALCDATAARVEGSASSPISQSSDSQAPLSNRGQR
jgi:hypothetical protein